MRRACLIVLLAGGFCSPGFAQSSAWIGQFKACQDTAQADINKRADACTSALVGAFEEDGVKDADMAKLLLFRADAYLSLKDFDQAIKDADHAGKYSTIDAQVENMRCWTRGVANRELDVAAAACNEAIRLNKDDPALHDSRGLIGLRQGKWQEAYDGYREAAPFLNMPGSRYGLGLAALALGKVEDGERWITQALERNPKAGDELNGFGFAPEKMKAIGAKAKSN